MFTGIVEAVGRIEAVASEAGDVRISIDAGNLDLADVQLGDSIAVNGVCLTVIALAAGTFSADVSVETLQQTTIGSWRPGTRVNLEKALMASSRLGGHLVSGHVDGVGEVIRRQADARSERFWLRLPPTLAKYVAQKGSVTVDGTSLTVNSVKGADFAINIVPHTMAHTVFGDYRPGSQVNIEVDVIARYLERLLATDTAAEG